ncbi:MAG: magnesium transporter [Pseudomonadota bacterium]
MTDPRPEQPQASSSTPPPGAPETVATPFALAQAKEEAEALAADHDLAIDFETVAAILLALAEEDRTALQALIEDQHPADLADLLEQMASHQRRRFVEMLGADIDADILSELQESTRDEVVALMPAADLAEALKDLDTDDVVYLVEDLEPETQSEVLSGLEAGERVAVERSLSYPEYSAGRLMQREMVTAPAFRTVGEMIDEMRATEDLPQQFYEIIIVDPAHQPVGKVPLGVLMGNRREVVLEALMETEFKTFRVDTPQEDVGYAFNQYHLVSAPVVDESGRLAGVITIDDAMQALDEEAEEDILRLGGVGEESLGDAVARVTWRRFPWLAVNLATAVLASLVIGLFDAAIEQVVALAILMPIVASMGGNAGTQTMTVVVRSLATKDLTRTNTMRIIARETLVGLLNGLAFAVIIGGIGYLWFGDATLGLVLAIAMVINMLAAGIAGILIPLGLDRFGQDPALASSVFVTTVTDVVGFFAFLGIAAAVLL